MTRLLAPLLLCYAVNAHAILACVNTAGEGINWYIGQAMPPLDIDDASDLSCFATDAELAFIQSRITGLPSIMGSTRVLWRGENARFVLDSLRFVIL